MGDKSVCEFLCTKASDVDLTNGAKPAEIHLGGTCLYAPSEEILNDALQEISEAIITSAKRFCCITPKHLLGLCRETISIDMQIFRPCMNAAARVGNIELVRCLSEHGNSFRVIVETSNLSLFRDRLSKIAKIAQSKNEISIREIQNMYYPDREKGTWFIAQQILQRLAYLGVLVHKDKWSFQVPEILKNAKTEIGGEFRLTDPTRLA